MVVDILDKFLYICLNFYFSLFYHAMNEYANIYNVYKYIKF